MINNYNNFDLFYCAVEYKAAIAPKLKDFYHNILTVWQPYFQWWVSLSLCYIELNGGQLQMYCNLDNCGQMI